jgi:hypothetical protein
VHHYLVRGFVNAKSVAPWYFSSSSASNSLPDGVDSSLSPVQQVEQHSDDGGAKVSPVGDDSSTESLSSNLKRSSISNDNEEENASSPPQVRYLLDYPLNRFCRWLRILGLDAALETKEEERLRTMEGKS